MVSISLGPSIKVCYIRHIWKQGTLTEGKSSVWLTTLE